MDYQPGPTTFTLLTTTANGDTILVPLDILNDTAVEGNHTFFVEVVDSDLVIPGQAANIEIIDNDCEYIFLPCLHGNKLLKCGIESKRVLGDGT